MQHWLLKSEPDVYSLDHLKRDRTTLWSGVRNYQARNFMMTGMKPGDTAIFYHSNAEPSGAAGLCKILKTNLVDPSQFDKKSEFFDPKAKTEIPRWHCAEVEYISHFSLFLSLELLKQQSQLASMPLLQKGSRLSVQPVGLAEFKYIISLSSKSPK
jgi:predicted RNA-binding protein with PUA-like domain